MHGQTARHTEHLTGHETSVIAGKESNGRSQIVALAQETTAWMGLLAHPDHQARRWEPKRLRYRLFTIPATLARHGRRTILHLSNRSRWAHIILAAISALRALPAPSG